MEERIGSGKTAFVVTDRRGEKKPERDDLPKTSEQADAIEAAKDKSAWVDVSFILVQLQPNQNVIIQLIRAVGKRTDGRTFCGDYAMPPFWTEKQDMDDWQAEAKARLDTFLGCGCREGGEQCNKHRNLMPRWMHDDMERFDKIARKSMPESLEWYIRAENARQQSNIVAPGR